MCFWWNPSVLSFSIRAYDNYMTDKIHLVVEILVVLVDLFSSKSSSELLLIITLKSLLRLAIKLIYPWYAFIKFCLYYINYIMKITYRALWILYIYENHLKKFKLQEYIGLCFLIYSINLYCNLQFWRSLRCIMLSTLFFANYIKFLI